MPEAPIYANPSGGVTIDNMVDLVPLVDVWCPEQALMRRQPELAPFFLATGKPVWCYEAPPDVKTLHPLGYYRANSWMAFQLGLSGTGFWTQFYRAPGDAGLWLQGAPAGTLLGEDVQHATRKAWPCGDPHRLLRDYEMDFAEIQRIRQEVAELTMTLRKP